MSVSNRRNFLKSAAGGALAAGTIGGGGAALMSSSVAAQTTAAPAGSGMTLMAAPTISAEAGTNAFWDEVRSAFPLQNYIHMNTGTTGSMPVFAQNNLAVYNSYKSNDPLDWRANLLADFPDTFPVAESGSAAIEAHQIAIAEMYGANEDEIVLSYNTSDGCSIIIGGTPWKAGDRIVTTNLEHSGMLNPIRWARDTHGVEVEVVVVPSNFDDTMTVEDVVALFEPALSKPLGEGNKQYLAYSEIPYKNGVRFPVKALTQLARDNGAYTIIDSAHGWGMLPVNCHDYGVDFIAGAGHKWLCGGPGTGILYVRNSGDNLPPFVSGNFRQYNENQLDNRTWLPSVMQSRGEYNRPALYAMADTARFFDNVGLQNIYDQGVMLSSHLKDLVAEKWGKEALWVQKSSEPEFATFLTAFNPLASKDDPAQFEMMLTALNEVRDKLSARTDPKIYIRTITWHDKPTIEAGTAETAVGFRISTHPMYNNLDDVETMFNALVEELDKMDVEQREA